MLRCSTPVVAQLALLLIVLKRTASMRQSANVLVKFNTHAYLSIKYTLYLKTIIGVQTLSKTMGLAISICVELVL